MKTKPELMLWFGLVLVTPVLVGMQPQKAIAQPQPPAQSTSAEEETINQLFREAGQLRHQGKTQAALEKYQQLSKLVTGGRDRGIILHNIASLYDDLGRYKEALALYEQALVVRREVGDREGEGATLNNMGLAYDNLGQYKLALAFYQQALTIAQAVGNRSGASSTSNNIAAIYYSLGEHEKAIKTYQQALAMAKELGDRSSEGQSLNNLGAAYKELGHYQQALELYQQALVIRQEMGDRSGEGTTLGNMGLVYERLGQYGQALELHQQALEIAKAVGDRSGESTNSNSIGAIYSNLGQYDRALVFYRQALGIQQEIGDRPGESTTLNNMGAMLVRQKQFRAAEKPLYEAISIYESLRPGLGDRSKIALADAQNTPYRWLQNTLIQQNKIETALEISERGRGRALVELLASRLSNRSPEVLQQLNQPINPRQIKQVAKQQNATLVEYSKVAGNLYIWVIQPDGTIAFRKTTTSIESLSKLVISARTSIGVRSRTSIARVQLKADAPTVNVDSQANSPADANTIFKQLHQQLIEPIADLLPKNDRDRVIFIPQGELFLVPFVALIDARGKTLIERHTILTAPSIATLKLTAEKLHAKRNDAKSAAALVVGNPTMPKMADLDLSPLPGSEDEALAIAPLLNAQPLIGKAATKSTVINQITQADIIHLATHGLLDTIAGEMPGAIALAPDRPDELNDGLLTANEIFDLQLNAHLAVLSACSTGKGDITGDGVVGLSRSLIAAGVPSIVVSLWDVNDRSTSLLMPAFYRNLQTMDKAQALRQAMLTAMRQKNYQSPYHWAAFTLIGEAASPTSATAASKK